MISPGPTVEMERVGEWTILDLRLSYKRMVGMDGGSG